MKQYVDELFQSKINYSSDLSQKDTKEIWNELSRLQQQRDNDIQDFQDTANQLYEATNTKLNNEEYKKVLVDIKRLGQSLEEIENVMVRDACSKSGSVNSFIDLKRSMFSNRDENIGKGNIENQITSPYPVLKDSIVQQPLSTEKQEIYEEINKSKDDIIDIIENVRKEIYDNLDEILQSHVNALEEKKLLLYKDNDLEHLSDSSKFANIFNTLAKDIRVKVGLLEENLMYKVDISLFEDKINSIIDVLSQLGVEYASQEEYEMKCNFY